MTDKEILTTVEKVISEKSVEKHLTERLKKLKGWSIKLFPIHISGLPDRVCLLPGGKIFFAELKRTRKKETLIQKSVHTKLRELGFDVYVLSSKEKIDFTLKKYQ